MESSGVSAQAAPAPPSEFRVPHLGASAAAPGCVARSTWKDDLVYALFDRGPIGRISSRIPASALFLRWTPSDYDFPPHVAPRKQLVICLNSCTAMKPSDGATRTFGPGDCVLLSDTHGEGHHSQCVNGEARWSIFIELPADGIVARLSQLLESPDARLGFAAGLVSGCACVLVSRAARG